MSDTKIPERSQQRQEDLWDLTDLYPSCLLYTSRCV